jgi:hypothetical protein
MPAMSANWRWSMPSRARAARIWAAVIMTILGLHVSGLDIDVKSINYEVWCIYVAT